MHKCRLSAPHCSTPFLHASLVTSLPAAGPHCRSDTCVLSLAVAPPSLPLHPVYSDLCDYTRYSDHSHFCPTGFTNRQVLKFNGTKINNLAQLSGLIDACQKPYIRFDLVDDKVLILNAQAAREAGPEVLEQHNIPFSKSEDLR